jgi:hypothetical protein
MERYTIADALDGARGVWTRPLPKSALIAVWPGRWQVQLYLSHPDDASILLRCPLEKHHPDGPGTDFTYESAADAAEELLANPVMGS